MPIAPEPPSAPVVSRPTEESPEPAQGSTRACYEVRILSSDGSTLLTRGGLAIELLGRAPGWTGAALLHLRTPLLDYAGPAGIGERSGLLKVCAEESSLCLTLLALFRPSQRQSPRSLVGTLDLLSPHRARLSRGHYVLTCTLQDVPGPAA